jgi:hypothetical protein
MTFDLNPGADCKIELYTTERYQVPQRLLVKRDPFHADANQGGGGLVFKIVFGNGEIMNVDTYDATVVYGDTDSIFCAFAAPRYNDLERKIAYNMILGAYVADRITEYLRNFNIFKDDSEKWTELEYEKVYGNLLLFTKKRYTGTLFEFNPCKYCYIDKKGVALKRRDFCDLVKEVYYDNLKILFDDDLGPPKKRCKIATEMTQQAIRDLLANNVPQNKLVISNSLADQYVIQEKRQKKGRTDTFNKNNIFVGDFIVIDHSKYGLVEGEVVEKRDFDKGTFFDRTEFKKPLSVYFNLDDFVGHLDVTYTEIMSRSKYVLTLKKIIDPNTDERELEPMKRAHVRLTRKMNKRDAGSAPVSGERVPFLFVETPPKAGGEETLQWEKAEHPDYAKAHDMKSDAMYYLNRQLRNPIEQIFSLLVKDTNELFDPLIREYQNKENRQRELTSFFGAPATESAAETGRKRGRTAGVAPATKRKAKKSKQDKTQASLDIFFK